MSRSWLKGAPPLLWTFVPIYVTERIADYYYLQHDPFFFTVSGMRLELFIMAALFGGVAAGALVEDEVVGFASQALGVALALAMLYYLCDPGVCFSAGPEGLEPLRLGAFLAAVCVCGEGLGRTVRGVAPRRRTWGVVTGLSAFFALAYYPVILTFAGARLLGPLHPWPLFAVCLLAAFGVAVPLASEYRAWRGAIVPVLALGGILATSAGVAPAFIGELGYWVGIAGLGTLAGATLGAFLAKPRHPVATRRRASTVSLALSLALVLLMTVVVLPDAVSGVAPSGGQQAGAPFAVAAPVYAGAYMDSPPGHAEGAGVSVSFAGTNASLIQADNFLSGGLGIHAAGCCVDGIDFGYRFDLYLAHGGSESLVATGWEACDDNAACGGHPWKVLLFLHSAPLSQDYAGRNLTLRVQWENGSVLWSYSAPGTDFVAFAEFAPPSDENPGFNTGLIPGGSLSGVQPASYFFQFGVMSRYPIGTPSWGVTLGCPSLLVNGSWNCVAHAKTLSGQDSYWKVIWRWGEPYPNVGISAIGDSSARFESAASTTGSNLQLW